MSAVQSLFVHGARKRRHEGESLVFSEELIRKVSRWHGPRTAIGFSTIRAWCAETFLLLCRGIHFRSGKNAVACHGYRRMASEEFEGINARQAWANWRTIPRNLSGRLSLRPIRVIDLCCGIGDSTEVLAYYCPPGSRILGLEMHAHFVQRARTRDFFNSRHGAAIVEFNTQSVLEPFRDPAGNSIRDHGIDLINSSGAIGCHFGATDTQTLAQECRRVLRRGGLAMIDAGPEGVSRDELKAIFSGQGFSYANEAKSCLFDRYMQLCFVAT